MTKNQNIGDQTKQIILDIVKKERPETTQQLIKFLQEKTALSSGEITQLLIQLENEDKLHFTKKETLLPPKPQPNILSKKIAWYWVTIAIAILTTLTVFIIPDNAYPIVYLRSALGIVILLFLPGFTFIKMLFPSKVPIKTSSENMEIIERLALSLGMSLSLIPIVGLILNYTPWGIRLTSITLSLLASTIVFATAAVLREYQAKVVKVSA
jgi:magnesium-transporting ATPase (P-type)